MYRSGNCGFFDRKDSKLGHRSPRCGIDSPEPAAFGSRQNLFVGLWRLRPARHEMCVD